MKIAITGLENSGKTTDFNALTGLNVGTTVYPTVAAERRSGGCGPEAEGDGDIINFRFNV
ncbi:MAG: hypothetical protein M0024_00010 [Nitrospiraceae bacterium]|nr:hypothetical protein [Nitrospiraceae bacterium]